MYKILLLLWLITVISLHADYDLKITKTDEVLFYDLTNITEVTFSDLNDYELKVTTTDGVSVYNIDEFTKIDFSQASSIEQSQVLEKIGLVLIGSYPNPFNPSTTINFQTSETGLVRVAVYNGKGEMITILHDGYMTSGKHSIAWNSRNQQVSSGVYFVRIIQKNQLVSSKVLLVK